MSIHPLEFLGHLWLRSLRIQFEPHVGLPKNGILAVWHEHLLLCLPAFTQLKMTVLVSQSSDGDIAERACHAFGYHVIRGSSSRGGAMGLRQLSRKLKKQGGWAAIVIDGPRGPRRIPKPGVTWLSKATGIPITLATGFAKPAWKLNNWDRTVVPAPFAKVAIQIQNPFYPNENFIPTTQEFPGEISPLHWQRT